MSRRPSKGKAKAFGTCYAASTIEVAFAEGVIYGSGRFVGDGREVPISEITERSVVTFACKGNKALVLAALTGAALKDMGLNYDISASANYKASQTWAHAIQAASAHRDGIRYVSRQMNRGFAYAVFERSGLRRLSVERLTARQLGELCDRFNVTAI